jgi:hypothetical protein
MKHRSQSEGVRDTGSCTTLIHPVWSAHSHPPLLFLAVLWIKLTVSCILSSTSEHPVCNKSSPCSFVLRNRGSLPRGRSIKWWNRIYSHTGGFILSRAQKEHFYEGFWLSTELSTSLSVQQKGCSLDECTGLAFSATLGDQRTFRYDQRCCTTDKCNQVDTKREWSSSLPPWYLLMPPRYLCHGPSGTWTPPSWPVDSSLHWDAEMLLACLSFVQGHCPLEVQG